MGRIFFTGLLTVLPVVATIYFMVWLVGIAERVFGVRSIYGALRDMLGLFASHKEPSLEVVALALPGTPFRLLGFVTRKDFADLPPGVAAEGEVAVYLPMSYQLGWLYHIRPARARAAGGDVA